MDGADLVLSVQELLAQLCTGDPSSRGTWPGSALGTQLWDLTTKYKEPVCEPNSKINEPMNV